MATVLESRRVPEDPDSLEAQVPRLAAEGALDEAARVAIERQLGKGMAMTFLDGDAITKRFPDGHEEVVATIKGRSGSRIGPVDSSGI